MLSSIHPLGERGRGNSFSVTAAAFVVGSLLGGAGVGLILGTVGAVVAISAAGRLAILAFAAIVALGFDLSGRRLPSLGRQVNEEWLDAYRGWVYGFGFGLQLGAGVLTFITAASVVLWLGSMLAVGSIPLAILIGATFGLTRGLSILAARQVTTSQHLRSLFQTLHATAPRVRRVGIVALAVLTFASVGLAWTHIIDPADDSPAGPVQETSNG